MNRCHPSVRRRTHLGSAIALCGLLSIPGQLWAETPAVAAALSSPEVGVWYNQAQQGAVEIYPCQQAPDRLCGRIVWLRAPTNSKGQPLTDARNSDAALRKRPICGLPVLGNLRRVQNGWDAGWVYDPEQGQQFDAAIHANSGKSLTMTGYKGVKWLSKSFTWTRAPADLPLCGPLEPVMGPREAAVTPPPGKKPPQKPTTQKAPAKAPPKLEAKAAAPPKLVSPPKLASPPAKTPKRPVATDQADTESMKAAN